MWNMTWRRSTLIHLTLGRERGRVCWWRLRNTLISVSRLIRYFIVCRLCGGTAGWNFWEVLTWIILMMTWLGSAFSLPRCGYNDKLVVSVSRQIVIRNSHQLNLWGCNNEKVEPGMQLAKLLWKIIIRIELGAIFSSWTIRIECEEEGRCTITRK